MASMEHNIRLAQSLPPVLLRFFTRWPTRQIIEAAEAQSPAAAVQTVSNTSPSDPNANEATTTTTIIEEASAEATSAAAEDSPLPPVEKKLNPFLPWRNPRTGNWHSPHYSLRRQADLFKLAQKHHVLSLMPLSPKHPEVREQKRIEKGLRVQGTGEGKKVKGKKWERHLTQKLENRRKAMEGMPEMIQLWKEKGHGKGWKKYPR